MAIVAGEVMVGAVGTVAVGMVAGMVGEGWLHNPFSYNIPENQALPIYYID